MIRYVPIVIAVILIVWLAVVQGIWSDRWNQNFLLAEEFAKRLDNYPKAAGDWEIAGDNSSQSDPRVLEVAGAVGHKSLVYRHKRSGMEVSVYLVCGHSRKITGHTPDKCYPASGFIESGDPLKHTVSLEDADDDDENDPEAEFYTQGFRKESIDGIQKLRVFWTWTIDSNWQAPDYPRRVFAGKRAVYKMYLISPQERRDEKAHESVCVDFAEDYLPELTKVLFPQGSPQGSQEHASPEDASLES